MVVAGIGVAVFSPRKGNGWTRRKMLSLAISGGVVLGVENAPGGERILRLGPDRSEYFEIF
jgi:hypothetical protein